MNKTETEILWLAFYICTGVLLFDWLQHAN